jgi:hypothetical protein
MLAVAVPGQLLLDPPVHLVHHGEPEPGHMERVEHPHRRGQAGAQRGGVTAIRVQRTAAAARARSVSDARGAIASDVSDQVVTSRRGLLLRQHAHHGS